MGTTDWEKSLKLRRGEFSVLGAEPARPSPPNGLFVDGPLWAMLQGELRFECTWSGMRGAGLGAAGAGWRCAVPLVMLPCFSACALQLRSKAAPPSCVLWLTFLPPHITPPAWSAEDDMRVEQQLNAVIDQQLSSPAGLEAMRAHLESLLPREE